MIGEGADILGPCIASLLGRREQRVQHLDRRLEHLDEFHQPLRRPVEGAGIAVGVRVVLAEMLELADIELADQRRDVLVVLVARLGLGHTDLAQPRGQQLDHREARDVAVELVEPLHRPGRDQPGEQALRDVVLVLEEIAHELAVEEAERGFEDRADLLPGLEHIDRLLLHQAFQYLRPCRLAAADRAEQVEDLLTLLQPLRGVAEEADDALGRLLHAIEFAEGLVSLDGPIEIDAAQPLILAGVDQLRFSDRPDHPLCGRGPHHRVVSAPEQIILKRKLLDLRAVVRLGKERVQIHSSDPFRFVRTS